ncbi:hypothetical protein CEXT_194881 [Caerostris extrusa]|uniref:Uncharacterized protein n=1 Tax=Caerostris extrusa TaxID=172846 RepID=A0AAV4M6I1_CAEEX|nr:hypothetical protein CEXT_194881 [Caerostris extrusa]
MFDNGSESTLNQRRESTCGLKPLFQETDGEAYQPPHKENKGERRETKRRRKLSFLVMAQILITPEDFDPAESGITIFDFVTLGYQATVLPGRLSMPLECRVWT